MNNDNATAILRSLIIYGLCLPLAIYLGYVLAQQWGRAELAFVVVVCCLPLIPVLMKWHHLLLIASWNMSIVLFFIQGSPHLWMGMTALSLTLTALQYFLKRNVQFATVSTVAWPLLMLGLVILITAHLTGGIGLASFGGESYGGKRYIQLFCAIAGYFAISSHRIEPGRGIAYTSVYFLGALTLIIGSLSPWMPASFRMVYALFPVERIADIQGGGGFSEYTRLSGISSAAVAILCFILARYGLMGAVGFTDRWRFLPLQFRGGLGINQPWRILVVIAIAGVSLVGGYRSVPINLLLITGLLFLLERLYRTRMLVVLVMVGILGIGLTLPFIQKLPFTVQRSLSFLPIKVSDEAKLDARESSEWRLRMWQDVIPTIPQYLLIGKGYAIDAREQEMARSIAEMRGDNDAANAKVVQDYHNGPLSLLIPLGIFGVITFLWFLVAGFRLLLNNYRYGDPINARVNRFLLAYFIAKVLFFFLIFGSFPLDLSIFTGLVALSAALNGGMKQPAVAPAKPNPAYQPFRLPKPLRA